MRSLTPTLLDPFEIGDADGSGPRRRLASLDQLTEWFDRAALPFEDLAGIADIAEISVAPPWTPEPVDRRWRARGWSDDV